MLDERTRRAGERAAAARRRAFAIGSAGPQAARPLGVVPTLLLCLLGALFNGYAVATFDYGLGFEAAAIGLAGFAVVAALALAVEHPWAWTLTWMYFALHVFLFLLVAEFLGAVAFAFVVVYTLALTYATGRRAVEITED